MVKYCCTVVSLYIHRSKIATFNNETLMSLFMSYNRYMCTSFYS